jgi:carboxyl-terminal processing protease
MFRFTLLCLLALFSLAAEPKVPLIAPKDVKTKLDEIFKAHVTYKQMTPQLAERALANFIDELDPSKTYLLAPEIDQWIHPDPSLLDTIASGFKQWDVTPFETIYSLMLRAIERRGEIEQKIATLPLPTDVTGDEFKDLGWADTEEALADRLLRIRALQIQAAAKLEEASKELFTARIEKRRINREQELTGASPDERSRLVLSYLLKAVTSALDSHTNYFTPAEANQFMIQVQQRLFGIGAQLRDNLDGLTVMRILENSPASQSNKLKINDKIIAVNKEPIVGMDIGEAVELIRGEKGTPVSLTILRDVGGDEKSQEKLEIELVRGEVVLEDSRLETAIEPFGDGALIALKLYSFYQDPKYSSAADIRKAIENAQQEHDIKGVLLDLRGNAGGLLSQAVAVTGLFINRGVVVSVKDNNGKLQHLRELDGKPTWEGPLVVLVNRASASAAEIVAQTLQDYGRAIIIGDQETFGKGSFQTFTLDAVNSPKINPQGEYKVTRGRYYTVSGKSPQLVGVQSDVVVPGLLSSLEIGEKFAKFPLENDTIEPHFEDDLSDLSPIHRLQLGPLYKHNKQEKLTRYQAFLDKLQRNSAKRIDNNKNYKQFLAEIEKKNFDSESIELFSQADLQFQEALNVLKDLVFLLRTAA